MDNVEELLSWSIGIKKLDFETETEEYDLAQIVSNIYGK